MNTSTTNKHEISWSHKGEPNKELAAAVKCQEVGTREANAFIFPSLSMPTWNLKNRLSCREVKQRKKDLCYRRLFIMSFCTYYARICGLLFFSIVPDRFAVGFEIKARIACFFLLALISRKKVKLIASNFQLTTKAIFKFETSRPVLVVMQLGFILSPQFLACIEEMLAR